jgi:glycerophosphoryl diester phosphodiesterase
VVELEMNVGWINLYWLAEYADSYNNATHWGMPARSIKCTTGPWERVLYGTCYYYFVVRFTFELRLPNWDIVVPDEGNRVKVAGSSPARYVQYKDEREENGITFLDGSGNALAAGATTWELDIGLTQDGVPVVLHDRRLNPDMTRDRHGAWIDAPTPTLASLPLAVLQSYDVGRLRPGTRSAAAWPQQQSADGERVPTLDAVFELALRTAPASLRFNIETKLSPLAPDQTASPEAFVAALLASIDRHGLRERVTVQSFDWRTLQRLQQRAPGIATAALTAERPDFDTVSGGRWSAGLVLAEHGGSVPRLVKALGAPIWSPNFRDLTPERLAEARALGLRVIPWTVNAPEDIERLLGWPIDGLISDYPDRVVAALAARRAPAAAPR